MVKTLPVGISGAAEDARGTGAGGGVERGGLGGDGRPGEVGVQAPARRESALAGGDGVVEAAHDGRREARDVAGRERQAGDAVDDDLAQAARPRRDQRSAGGRSLERGDPERLVAAREHGRVGAGEEVAQRRVVDVAEQPHRPAHPRDPGAFREPVGARPGAGDQQVRPGVGAADRREGGDEVVHALLPLEAADVEQAGRALRPRRRRGPPARVDAVVHHGDVVGVEVEEPGDLRAHGLRAGDDGVGAAGEPPLHGVHLLVERLREPAAVPARLGGVQRGDQRCPGEVRERDRRVPDEPVVGVDDVGRPVP